MPEEQQSVESTRGYLLLPMQGWPVNQWHISRFVALPASCVSVRVTLSPSQEFRGSSLLAGAIRLIFRNSDGNLVRGGGGGIVARSAFEPGEDVPVTGHEAGQQPGEFPALSSAFEFVVNDSLGAHQINPYGAMAGVEFCLSHNHDPLIQAAATIEAFDLNGNSLEIV